MIGWESKTLGDLMNIGRGASPRPIQNFITKGPGIPWVKIADATKSINKYIERTKEFIIEEGRRKTVYPGELIVSNSATPGIPKLMKIEACVHDGWLVFDKYKNIDTLYLYYFFLDYRRILAHSASGTVFKNLTTEIVRNVSINLPPLQEQKAITKVLTAFDDKIELLQAQNKTLETMAQTIFKEWFGKHQIGDELPEGWRVGKLGDFNAEIADFVANGSFASLKENVTLFNHPEHALFIRNTDLKSDFKEKTYVDKKAYDFLSKTKLFGGEIIISNVGDVGSVHLCPQFKIPMTLGNNIIMLKSEHNFFFYTLFKSRIGQHLISTITGGSAQPKFNKTDFRNMGLIIPPNNLLNNFEFASSKFYEKILKNKEQILSLTKTRDTLLPKLMSGQVRVNNIKQTANA